MLTYVLFAIGFLILIKGADWLVEGSSNIAAIFKIPPIVIGLTIVSFGTSAPELAVNIFASMGGNSDLNLGNILGSNISNILLILGIAATIYPLTIKHGTVWKEIPLALLAVIILGLTANDALIDGHTFNLISRIDGAIFLSFFIIFMYYTFGISKIEGHFNDGIIKHSIFTSIIMIIGGMISLVLGGKWIVDGAMQIARHMEMSEAMIGLTVVAIGTSLPELATSAVAAYKKNADIAVGNIVGSNIFNIFLVLGITSLINPIQFNPTLNIDIIIVILVTILLFVTTFVGEVRTIEKWQGVSFIGLYGMYIIYIIGRG